LTRCFLGLKVSPLPKYSTEFSDSILAGEGQDRGKGST
jgi:hypothetical protein